MSLMGENNHPRFCLYCESARCKASPVQTEISIQTTEDFSLSVHDPDYDLWLIFHWSHYPGSQAFFQDPLLIFEATISFS